MLAAHAAICAAPLQPPAAPTLSKTKSGRTASIDAQGDDNSDTEEEDVAPVPRKSSSRRPSKQLSGDGDRNSPTTSSTTDATMGELPGANRTESTSPRSRVVGDDVVLLRPETTVEELQSQLEETILRIHVLSRQHASTEHAMLDDDFGASERAELRGVLSELTAELSRQTEKKKGLERRLKKSGVELHSPTMRIVDHGGLLELDDGVELDTSSDDLDLHHEDSDDDGEDGAYPPYLRRARSSEDTRVPAGAGSKLALSISAQSVLKKKGSGSSLKERKNNQMSMSYIDRPTALPPVRRGERGPSLTGNALLPKRPEGQAPKPPA
jgi:hypothetical protein